MDVCFQEKKTVGKFVRGFISYDPFCDTGDFRRFFKHPVVPNSLSIHKKSNNF